MYKLIYNNIWKKYILSNKRKEASRVSIYKCNYLETLLLGFLPIKILAVKEKKLATGYEFRMQIEFVTNCLTIQLALSILKSLHYLNIHLTSSTMEKKNFINKK